MDQESFSRAEKILDDVAEQVDHLLDSAAVVDLRNSLQQLAVDIGRRFSVELEVVVQVTESAKERTLPLLQTGIAVSAGSNPYRVSADCTPQRYLVEGDIEVVPHDRCPKCWGVWDFKLQNHRCGSCGVQLGKDVKVLLDRDVCPHCEKGKVTATSPRCGKCGFEIDPQMISWG